MATLFEDLYMGRFGHAAVSLGLCVAVVDIAFGETVSAAVTPIEQAQFINWTGRQHQSTVKDGSVLTEYQGITEALNRPGMLLAVSFSPRFSCTPMIALQLPAAGVDVATASAEEDNNTGALALINISEMPEPNDDELLDLRVDGVSVDFPLIVDTGERSGWHFNGDARERETLRLQFDIGDMATLSIAEDRNIIFSLLGSRKTLKFLQASCRQHEPLPFED